jgi:HTH-type transcriptional regulator/antitoxin HigA
MTLTFNPEKYKEILVTYQPKLIKTEAENEQALTIIEELMQKTDLSPEEDELYQLLIVLVEKFEREYYLGEESATPHSVLLLLMDQKGVSQSDLVGIMGDQEVVSEIINGKTTITKNQAKTLAEYFNVSAELFL